MRRQCNYKTNNTLCAYRIIINFLPVFTSEYTVYGIGLFVKHTRKQNSSRNLAVPKTTLLSGSRSGPEISFVCLIRGNLPGR